MNKQIYRLIKEYTEQHFMHDIINDEVNKNIDVVNDFIYNKDCQPRTKKELRDIIKKFLNDRKYDIEPIDLNFIDVSQITDFSYLFNNMIIKQIDISMWDVANGLRFTGMFSKCDASLFNCNLNDWRINPEADTSFMFVACT